MLVVKTHFATLKLYHNFFFVTLCATQGTYFSMVSAIFKKEMSQWNV